MSTSVATIDPDRPLSTAARRLDNNGIKHLVVVDDSVTSGVIVEVVDAGDFVLGFLSDCVVKADEATL
jgi:CBS domain-containing protein